MCKTKLRTKNLREDLSSYHICCVCGHANTVSKTCKQIHFEECIIANILGHNEEVFIDAYLLNLIMTELTVQQHPLQHYCF